MAYCLRQARSHFLDEDNWSEAMLEAARGETWMKSHYKHLAKELDVYKCGF